MRSFQSTPSVGRATKNRRNTRRKSKISIHALRGEGDNADNATTGTRIGNFNPRPPWGGRRLRFSICFLLVSFQSTPSVGRATVRATAKQKISAISIHALRGEGDYYLIFLFSKSIYFNPRPPWGGRHTMHLYQTKLSIFQSTPSVGRATRINSH